MIILSENGPYKRWIANLAILTSTGPVFLQTEPYFDRPNNSCADRAGKALVHESQC